MRHAADQRDQELESLCRTMRVELIELLHRIQTGHPGGSLSCCEILATLYFECMNIRPEQPDWNARDRFVLSKGHAAPMLYLTLAHRGFFPVEWLPTLRQYGSRLQGHPCAHKTPGIDCSTGPLGLGLSAALGMALAARLDGQDYTTWVLLGDGEIQEGGVWEAAMSANKFRPGRWVAILDHNGVQLDGTNNEVMPMDRIADRWQAFGWEVFPCDGHSIPALREALNRAKASDAPALVIAETVKGKGVSFMEGQSAWHGKPVSREDCLCALKELGVDRNAG